MCGEWLKVLADAAGHTSCAAVARELGVSRTAVSLCLSGKYAGRTDRMEQRVLGKKELLMQLASGSFVCPASGKAVSRATCSRRRGAPVPTCNPYELRIWLMCQRCEHAKEMAS